MPVETVEQDDDDVAGSAHLPVLGRGAGTGATLGGPARLGRRSPVKKILLLLVVIALGAVIAKKVRAA
jgi:hypothetical protein